MTDKDLLNDQQLDGLFDLARKNAARPSDDLMARVLADATEIAAQNSFGVTVRQPTPTQGKVAAFLNMIGGWPAAAGLATAMVVGIVIGVTGPETIETWTNEYLADASTYQIEDLLPSYGGLLDEG